MAEEVPNPRRVREVPLHGKPPGVLEVSPRGILFTRVSSGRLVDAQEQEPLQDVGENERGRESVRLVEGVYENGKQVCTRGDDEPDLYTCGGCFLQ